MLVKKKVKINRNKKLIRVWEDTQKLLQKMSDETGIMQVELVHEAIVDFEKTLRKSMKNQAHVDDQEIG